MVYKFIVSHRFKADIAESKKWYNEQGKGLGKKFYNEVKNALLAIRKTPHFYKRYDQVLCLPIKKYLFMIHYEVDDLNNTISVFSCIHCSLDPDESWIKKK